MAGNGDLIPLPVSYEEREGFFCFVGSSSIVAPPELFREAEVVAGWLSSVPGIGKVSVVREAASEGAGSRNTGTGRDAAIRLSILPDTERGLAVPEAYELEIAPAGIEIRGADAAGVVRGAASLWQLVLAQGARVGAALVKDEPRFRWRGLMLDCVRNFFEPAFIEKLLDLAALHKLNVFHWHLTDDQAWRLEIPSKPELTERGAFRQDLRFRTDGRKGGYYSRKDVARIVEYARVRHILVVPEIELPGHSTALLASHPEFSCLGAQDSSVCFEPEDRYGIFDDIVCGGNERALSFLSEVLGEVCAMFPGDFVHMGGDEVPKVRWLACPACQKKMAMLGVRKADGSYEPERLQAWFMERLAEMLARRGKRMIGWDEVVEGGISNDTLVMCWRNSSQGRRAAKLGYDVVMCPQEACYLDHKHLNVPEEPGQLGTCTVEDSYNFEPVPEGLSDEEKEHIIGGQANLWSELLYFGRQVEYMLFPRLCALSEVFWSPRQKRSFEDFIARLGAHKRRLDALDVLYYKGRLS
ncbi:MAG: beta-N-acetylhexosaminidase [Rectinema sp.]